MFEIDKKSAVKKELAEADMEKINRYTRRPFAAEEVYTFSVRACDDQPDRDYERFTAECLAKLGELFVGKTVIFDHAWTAVQQTARIYDAEVVRTGAESWLRLDIYMLKNEGTKAIIDAIDGGILKEVSVGCAVNTATCSVCGEDYSGCPHVKGRNYDGKPCICVLSEPTDAYELSFVAVPAQPKAGVQKSAGRRSLRVGEIAQCKSRILIERLRYGSEKL